MWEGVWDRIELQHIDRHSIGHNCVSFPFPWAAQQGAHSAGCWLSLPHPSPSGLVSKLTDFLSSPSYIIVQRPLLLVGVTIALIQPIHGQGYNSDIPRPDAPVIYIGAFPILTARPGRRSIYNTTIPQSIALTISPRGHPFCFSVTHTYIWLNRTDTSCLPNFFFEAFKSSISRLTFEWNWFWKAPHLTQTLLVPTRAIFGRSE